MDLSVTLRGRRHELRLKNPVMTASGTFGYGTEFAPYGDLSRLGGMVVKGLSLQPRDGNPCPRIVETTAGMLNAVGLQNDGVDSFLRDKLPRLPWEETPVVANLYATSAAEFAELAARLDEAEGVAALEVNISCPNVKQGGILFGQDPAQAAAVTRAVVDAAPHKPVIVKLSPNVTDIAGMARAVAEGYNVVTPLFRASLSLRGKVFANDLGHTLDPERLTVGVNLRAGKAAREAVSGLRVTPYQQPGLSGPVIQSVVDPTVGEEGKLTPGCMVLLKGLRMAVKGEDSSVGVYFRSVEDENVEVHITPDQIYPNMPKQMQFKLPPEVVSGTWLVRVVTQMSGNTNILLKEPASGEYEWEVEVD